jgi:hypothetical protein
MAITTGAKNTIETPVAEVNKENTKPKHPTKIIENRKYFIPSLPILGEINFAPCLLAESNRGQANTNSKLILD